MSRRYEQVEAARKTLGRHIADIQGKIYALENGQRARGTAFTKEEIERLTELSTQLDRILKKYDHLLSKHIQ